MRALTDAFDPPRQRLTRRARRRRIRFAFGAIGSLLYRRHARLYWLERWTLAESITSPSRRSPRSARRLPPDGALSRAFATVSCCSASRRSGCSSPPRSRSGRDRAGRDVRTPPAQREMNKLSTTSSSEARAGSARASSASCSARRERSSHRAGRAARPAALGDDVANVLVAIATRRDFARGGVERARGLAACLASDSRTSTSCTARGISPGLNTRRAGGRGAGRAEARARGGEPRHRAIIIGSQRITQALLRPPWTTHQLGHGDHLDLNSRRCDRARRLRRPQMRLQTSARS